MASEILVALAGALLKDYVAKAFSDLPDVPTLVSNLEKLVKGQVLDIAGLDVTKLTTDVTKKVHDTISALQKKLKVSEQFLGRKTMEALNNECLADSTKPSADIPVFLHDFSYFVTPDWSIDGIKVADLVERAWNSWQKVANIRCRNSKSKEAANLVIQPAKIDGQGNVLADATVGQGRGSFFPMTMRVDQGDQWTAEKFQAVITHELGHVIGLGHSNAPSQLMNPTYQPGISGPQSEDAQRAIAIWGPAPDLPQPPEPVKPPEDMDVGVNKII